MLSRFSDIRAILALMVGSLAVLLGGWDHPLQLLVFLVIADWVAALMARGVTGKVNSSVGWKGVAKKVGYFILVALAHKIDGVILTGMPAVRTAVVLMLAGNEGISILENLAELNVPIPVFLRDALEKARKGDAPTR